MLVLNIVTIKRHIVPFTSTKLGNDKKKFLILKILKIENKARKHICTHKVVAKPRSCWQPITYFTIIV